MALKCKLHSTKFQKTLNGHPKILADVAHKKKNNSTFCGQGHLANDTY
jgi:uncharacterized Zn-finger protein